MNGEPEMIVAEARPSYRVSNGTVTMMTIRDESASSQPAGIYTLTTQCIGTGELDVRFTRGTVAVPAAICEKLQGLTTTVFFTLTVAAQFTHCRLPYLPFEMGCE